MDAFNPTEIERLQMRIDSVDVRLRAMGAAITDGERHARDLRMQCVKLASTMMPLGAGTASLAKSLCDFVITGEVS